MSDLFDEALKEKYRQYFVNDPLAFAKEAIDWTAPLPLLKDLYHNDTDRCGRPNIPIITMVKVSNPRACTILWMNWQRRRSTT